MMKFIYVFFTFLFFINNNLIFPNTGPGNTNIVTQTTLSYEKKSGELVISVSNYVVVKLNEITSFSVDNYLPEIIINKGDNIIIPYKISNHGNIPDSYIINSLDFSIFSEFNFFIDENNNGIIDPDENTSLENIGTSFFKTPIVDFDNGINLVFKGILNNSFNSNNALLNLTVQSTLKQELTQNIQNNIIVQPQSNVKVRKAIFFDKNEKQFYFTFKFSNENSDTLNLITLEDSIDPNFRISNYVGQWKPFFSDEKKAVTFFSDGFEKEDPNLSISLINNLLKIQLKNVPNQLQTGIGGTLFIPFIVDPTLPENTILRNSAIYNYLDGEFQSNDFTTNEVVYFLRYTPKAEVFGDSSPENISTPNNTIYKFKNTITNLGNNSDIFNVVCKNSNFPGEIKFINIVDSNNDNIPDTGPLGIGETKEIFFTVTMDSHDIENKMYSSNKIFISTRNPNYIVSTSNNLDLNLDHDNILFIKEQGTSIKKYTTNDIEVNSTNKIFYRITLKNSNPNASVKLAEIFDEIPENTTLSNGNGLLEEGGKPVYKKSSGSFIEIPYLSSENKLELKDITINSNETLTIFFNVDVN